MRRLIAALFAMSLMLVGCGSADDDPGDTSASESASAAGPASSSDTGSGADDGYGEGGGSTGGGSDDAVGAITVSGFAYGDPLTVAPGALVLVVNEDPQEHSATAEDGSFDTGLIGSGQEMTFTAPSVAGTYDIMCTAHTDMAGQLIVSA